MQRCMLSIAHSGPHAFIQTRGTFTLPGECPSTPASMRRALQLPARKDAQRAQSAAGTRKSA